MTADTHRAGRYYFDVPGALDYDRTWRELRRLGYRLEKLVKIHGAFERIKWDHNKPTK